MLLQVILLFALVGFILAIVAITKKPDPQIAKNEAQVAKNDAAIAELQKWKKAFNDKIKGVPNTIGLAQCKYGTARKDSANLSTSAEIICPGVKVAQGKGKLAPPSLKFEPLGQGGGQGGWLACQDGRNLNGQCTELAYASGPSCGTCAPASPASSAQ